VVRFRACADRLHLGNEDPNGATVRHAAVLRHGLVPAAVVRPRSACGTPGKSALVRVRNDTEVEIGHSREIAGVAGEQRQLHADGRRRNKCVVCARRRFASGSPELGRETTECPGGGSVEGERIEVGLGQLEVSLPTRAFVGIIGDQGADGEFSQGDGADDRFVGKQRGICHSAQQDDRRCV